MPYVNPNTPKPPAASSADAPQDNTIIGLRTELFATLRDLRAGKVDVEQARAVSDLAQTIINTAKVEVDHAKVTGSKGAGRFLALPGA